MKKVVLTAVFAFATVTTFANIKINPIVIQNVIVQEEYKEIAAEELPTAVKEAVMKDFKGASIQKAYVNANNEYKLELIVAEVAQTVYADANGNWLKKE